MTELNCLNYDCKESSNDFIFDCCNEIIQSDSSSSSNDTEIFNKTFIDAKKRIIVIVLERFHTMIAF